MFDIPVNPRRLEEQVAALEQKEVETGKILFYGDRVFAGWEGILEDTSAYVNNSLDAATAEDLLYYYGRLVRPYKPKMLVVSVGDHDMGYLNWEYSPEEVMANLARLCHWAKTDFPGMPILLLEYQVCARDKWHGSERDEWVYPYHCIRRYNDLVRQFAATTENVHALTLWDKPEFFETAEDVGNPRKIREDLYEEDELHFNAAGYELLAGFVRPEVDKYV